MSKANSELFLAKPTPILFLDLDSTVRKGVDELGHFVHTVADVEVFPAAVEQMKKAKAQGWRIVAITNQGGVALGSFPYSDAVATLAETNKQTGELFDKMMMCIHHPDAKDPEMAVCWCRKPKPGMVIEAAIGLGVQHNEYYPPHMALFVGDRPEDQQCAEAAGIQFMDAKKWRGEAHE